MHAKTVIATKLIAANARIHWAGGLNGLFSRRFAACGLALLLAGCAASGSSRNLAEAPHYRCEQGVEFTLRQQGPDAVVDSNRGYEVLQRDAGGQGPAQTVFSNPRLRGEFGLGAEANEASLRFLPTPLAVRCVRD
jgi:hypothetical protein